MYCSNMQLELAESAIYLQANPLDGTSKDLRDIHYTTKGNYHVNSFVTKDYNPLLDLFSQLT